MMTLPLKPLPFVLPGRPATLRLMPGAISPS